MIRSLEIIKRREFLHKAALGTLGLMIPPLLRGDKKAASKTAFLTGDIYLKHKTGRFHAESPQRLVAIREELKASHLLDSLQILKPRQAGLEWVEKVHGRDYIEIVRRDVQSGASHLSTKSGNTVICKDSFDVALWAVGGVLEACDAVMAGRAQNAFCAIRPPGHHATPVRGMGYCLFNNVSIAACYLQARHKVNKVLIMDWDVHHGNGTQDIFYEDGSVFFCSTHQWPWYPWSGSADETGEGIGRGTTLNFPLPAGSGDQELIESLEKLQKKAEGFKPDFVLISAGFDSRESDPLGRFRVTDDGFRSLTRIMLQIAADHAEGRLVSVLEGGYNVRGLAKAVSAHVATLRTA